MKEKHMVKELGFLEDMMLGYEDQMAAEYKNYEAGNCREFAEAKRKRDMTMKIMRLVRGGSIEHGTGRGDRAL